MALGVGAYLYRHRVGSLAHIHRSLQLPEHFGVLDLETTGLDATTDEIIEIGAIRVNRDSDVHTTFQAFVHPTHKIPKAITKLTGITKAIADAEDPIEKVLWEFSEFAGNLSLITHNAKFDMAFIHEAAARCGSGLAFANPISCALTMARRAWPKRRSYRLADLSRDGKLSQTNSHRSLGDCQRALTVYTTAVDILQTIE